MRVQTFSYQFKGMRKPDDIIVYPRKDETDYTFQGTRLIGTVDPNTGKGMLNYKGSNSKYFMHLMKFMGATPCEYQQDFINLVKEFAPNSGDLIGSSEMTGPVYLA